MNALDTVLTTSGNHLIDLTIANPVSVLLVVGIIMFSIMITCMRGDRNNHEVCEVVHYSEMVLAPVDLPLTRATV